jgi:hypothetical protein
MSWTFHIFVLHWKAFHISSLPSITFISAVLHLKLPMPAVLRSKTLPTVSAVIKSETFQTVIPALESFLSPLHVVESEEWQSTNSLLYKSHWYML